MAKGGMTVARIRSKEDRNKGRGNFITLKKTNDQFMGYALFVPDPERKDNVGWYEYLEHYTPATGYCPHAEEDCPLCEEGDNPSSRAKTVWLVVDKEDSDPSDGTVKVFNMNWSVVQEFVDLFSDDEPILGQLFRIKRLEGNGKYAVRPKRKKLKKGEITAALKDAPDLEKVALAQMKKAFEELDVAGAMEEDDEEDEKPKSKKDKADKSESKSRKGTAKKKDEEPEEEEETQGDFDPEEDDECEDLVVTVNKVKKKDNVLVVQTDDDTEFEIFGTDEIDLTEYSKGDTIKVDAEKDEDDDFVVSAVEETEEEETEEAPESEEDEVPDKIEGETVTIVSVNNDEDTMNVKLESGAEFELFFLDEGDDGDGNDWSDFDLDDYEEGEEFVLTAHRDEDGDMLAGNFPEKAGKKSKKGGKKGGKKKK